MDMISSLPLRTGIFAFPFAIHIRLGNLKYVDLANVTGDALGREEPFTSSPRSIRGILQNPPPPCAKLKTARARQGSSLAAAARET
jgi:hypothetical protein